METGSQTLESVCVAALMQASEQQVQTQLWGRPSLQPVSKSLSFRPPLRSAYSVPRLAPIHSLSRSKLKPSPSQASEVRISPSSTSRFFPLVKLAPIQRNTENARVTSKLQTATGRKLHFRGALSMPVPLRTDLQVIKYRSTLTHLFYAPLTAKLLPFRPPLLDRTKQ